MFPCVDVRFKRLLFVVFILTLIFMPKYAIAQPITNGICPSSNCEESRILSLTNPLQTGDDVKELQHALTQLGFYHQPLNGIYDQDTHKAVLNFQQKHKLPTTGSVNENTWAAMTKAIEMPIVAKISAPPDGKKVILIDTNRRKLTLFNDGKPFHQFPVAVGKMETPTPIGNWKIIRKATNWGTGFGTRWLGLNVNWGIYGIHGTNKPYSIGGYQSHGCIRMFNGNVEQLYKWVSVGTPVIIVGNTFRYMETPYMTLRRGDRGAAVVEVQNTLKRLGYQIEVDGIWGSGMEKVIIQYRKDNNLTNDNSVDRQVYKSLGLL